MNHSKNLILEMADLAGPTLPLMYQVLAEHGRTFKLKQDVATGKGIKKECYRNSENLATFSDRYLIYCEGYACKKGLIPLPHAWVLDLEDGCVIDPTWDDMETDYFGCAFDTKWVNMHTLRTGTYSVFQNLYQLRDFKKPEDVKAYIENGLYRFD